MSVDDAHEFSDILDAVDLDPAAPDAADGRPHPAALAPCGRCGGARSWRGKHPSYCIVCAVEIGRAGATHRLRLSEAQQEVRALRAEFRVLLSERERLRAELVAARAVPTAVRVVEAPARALAVHGPRCPCLGCHQARAAAARRAAGVE